MLVQDVAPLGVADTAHPRVCAGCADAGARRTSDRERSLCAASSQGKPAHDATLACVAGDQLSRYPNRDVLSA
jgi:hypothetical protein